jgi:hypothetical protein
LTPDGESIRPISAVLRSRCRGGDRLFHHLHLRSPAIHPKAYREFYVTSASPRDAQPHHTPPGASAPNTDRRERRPPALEPSSDASLPDPRGPAPHPEPLAPGRGCWRSPSSFVGPPTFDGFKSRWITPVFGAAPRVRISVIVIAQIGHRDHSGRLERSDACGTVGPVGIGAEATLTALVRSGSRPPSAVRVPLARFGGSPRASDRRSRRRLSDRRSAHARAPRGAD